MSDFAIDYARHACGDGPPRTYGPYELVGAGLGFCLYASRDAKLRDYPIVRQHTFVYRSQTSRDDPMWPVKSDHETLLNLLGALGPKGVIVDLRGNRGGNNPNWFLDWWSPAGWTDRFVQYRLDDRLGDASSRDKVDLHFSDDIAAWYARELDARKPARRRRHVRLPLQIRNQIFFSLDALGGWQIRFTASKALVDSAGAALAGRVTYD